MLEMAAMPKETTKINAAKTLSRFEVYGVERNALKYNGKYFDEDLMVLVL